MSTVKGPPPRRTLPTVPEPYQDVESLRAAVMALKEGYETLAGQRGGMSDTAVNWDDLVQLRLIKPQNVPRDALAPRDPVAGPSPQ